MANTRFDSSVSVFYFNTQIVTGDIISVDGLPGPRDLKDVTALGDAGYRWNPSLENVTFTLEALWNVDATVGIDTLFGAARTSASVIAFIYGPKGSTSGYVKYYGNCWIENYVIHSKVGDAIKATITCKVDGVVNKSTFPV